MYVLFALLRKVRETRAAWAVLEAGGSTKQVASALGIPEWRARTIKATAERADGAWLERLEAALADLDYAVRGGTNVDAATELTLLVAGASSGRRPDPRGAGLLARGVVAVQGAVLGGLVDHRHERAVLGLDRLASPVATACSRRRK